MKLHAKPICFLIGMVALLWTVDASVAATKDGWGIHAGSHLGIGRLGNDGNYPARSMDDIHFEVMPGYHWGPLLGGVLVDYSFVGQMSSAAQGNNSDLGGHQLLVGLGVDYEVAEWKFLLGYDFIGKYTVADDNTTPGAGIDFKSNRGLHLLFGYLISPNLFFDMELVTSNFHTMNVGSTETDLSNDPIEHWSFNLGFSVSF